jgi:histidyl-tRNA synthetase
LAYYTGPVFEIYDRQTSLRAVCGGGRYDNLLKDFGGPSVPATGFGMGDCVLEILLREKGLLNEDMDTKQVEYFVAYTDTDMKADALKLAAALRTAGTNADMAYKPASFKKILKQATAANAKSTIIIAQEYLDKKELVVKDMATGEQETILQADLLARLNS